MKKIICYQAFLLLAIVLGFVALERCSFPIWIFKIELIIQCCLISTLGGVIYCTRAIYINRCVHDNWDSAWTVWYYLRPIVSLVCGAVSYVFLKAGLIFLDASQEVDQGTFGYLAFSFLAGLNVDKFVKKLEDVGKAVFGIEPSRSSNNDN